MPIFRLVSVAAALSVLPAPISADATSPARQAATALVTVVADDAPISDLGAADFVLREKRTALDIARVDALNQVPLYVSLLLDISKPPLGTPPPVSDMRSALSAFVATIRSANPGAQISLTEVSGAAVPRVAFEAPPEELDTAIGRLVVAQQVDAVMLEGLADAARTLADKPTIRKAVVLIDFGSSEPTRSDMMRSAVQEAQNAQVIVWSVSIRGTSSNSQRDPAVKSAVDVTGGAQLTAVAASGLPSLLQAVANSLSSQYLVTFSRGSSAPLAVGDLTAQTKRGQKVLIASVMR